MIASPEGDMTTVVDIRAATTMVDDVTVYEELDEALMAVEQADTQLDEVGAMVRLQRLVMQRTRQLVHAALLEYPAAEVARATGVSRQAMGKRRRAAEKA